MQNYPIDIGCKPYSVKHNVNVRSGKIIWVWEYKYKSLCRWVIQNSHFPDNSNKQNYVLEIIYFIRTSPLVNKKNLFNIKFIDTNENYSSMIEIYRYQKKYYSERYIALIPLEDFYININKVEGIQFETEWEEPCAHHIEFESIKIKKTMIFKKKNGVGKKFRILIVDNDKKWLKRYKEIITAEIHYAHEIFLANNVKTALKKIGKENIDILITNVNMVVDIWEFFDIINVIRKKK